MKPDHDDVTNPILRRSMQRLVLGIMGCSLGNAEIAKLSLLLLAQEHRRQFVQCMLVGIGWDTVQLVYIDITGIELAQ